MNFSYQNYVKKMEYKPYNWPPDISLAGLHSRCSEPGQQNPDGVSCPCCGYTIKLKMQSWINRDIYEDFKQTGAGIPIYFGLMRFYTFVVLLLFIVNAPYFTYAMTKACMLQVDQCVDIGTLYFIDFSTMVQVLNRHKQHAIVQALMILQTIIFYILLIANNLSIFYLVHISKKCKVQNKSTKRFMSLLVQNIPQGTTEQQLKQKLILPNGKNPELLNVAFIKQLYAFDTVFRKRILAFFALKAMCIECLNPKKQQQKNQNLKKLNQQYQKMDHLNQVAQTKAIIMFEDHEQLMQIYKKYQFRQITHWAQRIYNKIKGEGKKTDIFVNYLPQLNQTLWVNMGEDHTRKMISKLISIGMTTVMLLFCYALFYYPLVFVLGVQSSEQKQQVQLTLAEKFLPTFVSLALVGMAMFFKSYMEKLGRERRPKTHDQQSSFVLVTTVMFHLIFYLIVPNIFYSVENGIDPSVKLFAISSQAQAFVLLQLAFSSMDYIFRLWRIKKMKTMTDQREAFKYPQKFLHQIVQFKQFPIQIKLIVIFKIWSMVLFYSFFVPIIMFYIVVTSFILYFLQKRNIYKHYVVRKHLSSKLEIRFLNIYINFFCIYQCMIYMMNQTSKWQQILALVSTFASLLFQLIYWIILRKKQEKINNQKIARAKDDVKRSKSCLNSSFGSKKSKKSKSSKSSKKHKSQIQQELIQSQKQVDSSQQQDDDPSYSYTYEKFLQQYNQPQLDEQIKNYLRMKDQQADEQQQYQGQRITRPSINIQMV